MNHDESYREQIEKHRQRIEKVKTPDPISSALPPRERAHRHKKKKTAVKLKYPVIRLLVLFFILLPLTVFSIISYMSENRAKPTNVVGGYDTVSLDDGEKQSVKTSGNGENDQGSIDEENPGVGPEQPERNKPGMEEVTPAPPAKDSLSGSDGKDGEQPEKPAVKPSSSNKAEAGQGSSDEQSNKSGEKTIFHTVKPGETLFRIAMTYYKSQDGIEKIRAANGINGNEIQVGETLKVPIH
ncbi:LysM peptidoglycan-binding domain-containing protein [Neobacillus notoginsengisoli]|uniref:LysM peptidoglycan-binding domain-containing protein n=1 Tax=Neobacillus notoginsengisoli TaxID=1578198 RepID=A0A417YVB7_9BACI|nr:LysM peptidoglycan-binding domain-containing protein [Neobacillus notoginsengisoli]RHW41219.1 LysM peptidoglycan-binding domain-containing protein [Neobacillus notoginsengisoli]